MNFVRLENFGDKSLNRNILECKFALPIPAVPVRLCVLIETYWNVNFLKALYTEFDKES